MDRLLFTVGAALFAGSFFLCQPEAPPAEAANPAVLTVRYLGDTVVLRGRVPSEGDREVVMDRARALLDGRVVIDSMVVRGVRSADWLRTRAIDAVLQPGYPVDGLAQLADTVLTLRGTVPSDSLRTAILEHARSVIDSGIVLEDLLLVVPSRAPSARPRRPR